MARRDTEQNVTQSVIERLIDREPSTPTDPPSTFPQSVRLLKMSLRRDIEWLLNSRRTPEPAKDTFAQLHRSLFNYGLPDVTSLSHESSSDRGRLLEMVELTISLFEPRLKQVKVTPLEALRGSVHVIRFQIEGMLMMDPEPEHISFDTVLQLASGQYDVRGGESGA